MKFTATYHQKALEMLWLHFCRALTSSMCVYSKVLAYLAIKLTRV